jgi:hypothetical protein
MTTGVVLFGRELGTGYAVPGKLQETALLEALVGVFPKGAVTVGSDTEGGGRQGKSKEQLCRCRQQLWMLSQTLRRSSSGEQEFLEE